MRVCKGFWSKMSRVCRTLRDRIPEKVAATWARRAECRRWASLLACLPAYLPASPPPPRLQGEQTGPLNLASLMTSFDKSKTSRWNLDTHHHIICRNDCNTAQKPRKEEGMIAAAASRDRSHRWPSWTLCLKNYPKGFDPIFWSYQVWTSWEMSNYHFIRQYLLWHLFKVCKI